MNIELPKFPYHRDPIASDSIRQSDVPCECCGEVQGVLYKGVVYSRQKIKDICPWCIASGTAADKFNAVFIEAAFHKEQDIPVELMPKFQRAVFACTIGFSTWNPFSWPVHCHEPTEYVTRIEPYEMIFECRVCKTRHSVLDFD